MLKIAMTQCLKKKHFFCIPSYKHPKNVEKNVKLKIIIGSKRENVVKQNQKAVIDIYCKKLEENVQSGD